MNVLTSFNHLMQSSLLAYRSVVAENSLNTLAAICLSLDFWIFWLLFIINMVAKKFLSLQINWIVPRCLCMKCGNKSFNFVKQWKQSDMPKIGKFWCLWRSSWPEVISKEGTVKKFSRFLRKILLGLQLYKKERGSGTSIFLWVLLKSSEQLFYRILVKT